jgi:hypothetical protein
VKRGPGGWEASLGVPLAARPSYPTIQRKNRLAAAVKKKTLHAGARATLAASGAGCAPEMPQLLWVSFGPTPE